jgi:hypothetical protein
MDAVNGNGIGCPTHPKTLSVTLRVIPRNAAAKQRSK